MDDLRKNYYKTSADKDLFDLFESGLLKNTESFYIGNIIKYIFRFHDKNGVDDLKKARTYLDRLIKVNEKQSINRG